MRVSTVPASMSEDDGPEKGKGKSAVEPEIGSVRRASRVKREEHRNAAECKTYEKAHQILVNAVCNKCSSTKCIIMHERLNAPALL